jgi:hypothetical protein
MMRTRTIQAAVMALVFAASAPIAHAGGGGAGSPVPGGMYDCYLISGVNAPQTLIMDDQFYGIDPITGEPGTVGPERTGVKLGKAKLLCTPAVGTVESGQLQPGDFSNGDHLKCYEAPPKGANPKVSKQVVDPFVTETVTVGVPQFTCVQAFKCDVGVPCGPGAE